MIFFDCRTGGRLNKRSVHPAGARGYWKCKNLSNNQTYLTKTARDNISAGASR